MAEHDQNAEPFAEIGGRLTPAEKEALRPVLARYAQWESAHDGPVFEVVEQIMKARMADLTEALETAREQRTDVLELLNAERHANEHGTTDPDGACPACDARAYSPGSQS